MNHAMAFAGVREVDFNCVGVNVLTKDFSLRSFAAGYIGSAEKENTKKRLIAHLPTGAS